MDPVDPHGPKTLRLPRSFEDAEGRCDLDKDPENATDSDHAGTEGPSSFKRGLSPALQPTLSRSVSLTLERDLLLEELEGTEERADAWTLLGKKGPPLMLALFVFPMAARMFLLESHTRCALILLSVLILSLNEVMPLYCVALFIPVLGSLNAVFGEARTMSNTSAVLLGSFFNQTSFLVMGSLVINSVFAKCGVLDRMTNALLRRWHVESKRFLLVMMMSTMFACSVLCSGSIVVLAAVKPLLMEGKGRKQVPAPVTKRLLLGVAFAANAGSTLLPISSTVNLITVSLLRDFDHRLSLWNWVFMATPIAILATFATWWLLIFLYPSERDDEECLLPANMAQDQPGSPKKIFQRQPTMSALVEEVELSPSHWFFLVATFIAVLGITVFAEVLEPVIGHPAILALAVVVLAFGSGFMTREEFLALEWDLLAIVGGTNVMAVMVRETALAARGTLIIKETGVFEALSFWPLVLVLVVGLLAFGTFAGHSLTGVIMLPLLVALGVKLKAAEYLAMLCALAIPFGMGMPSASFDNMASQSVSRSLGRKRCELGVRDYVVSGSLVAFVGAFLILTLGFGVGYLEHGMPEPPREVAVERTPEELEPKVIKEHRTVDLLEAKALSKGRLVSIAQTVGRLNAFGQAKRPSERSRPGGVRKGADAPRGGAGRRGKLEKT